MYLLCASPLLGHEVVGGASEVGLEVHVVCERKCDLEHLKMEEIGDEGLFAGDLRDDLGDGAAECLMRVRRLR